ncbi:hypothetical protein [Rodentibacter trehalosifermentans]|uniref:Lipoprotein n=1 Tax=Rodentibacter trehalosifermentans TaxID=1908263 RepID=A0A1V3J011_9PAST|nr:hypothetical protein [Rodentibacter trehalosifermentans]OOF45443.1 hypothetical protein BKK51_06385 [Rodentibacter trehalosifermentans]OOF48084.1 hypothetical protein BKK52_06730 [Rodentibacter trehalosifermentans]OOF49813.1 hypothetical protein BKK53_08475 [Rodentibacter trehalosifermentans]
MKKLLLIVLSAILLTGCTTRWGEYSLLSNRNIDISHSQNFTRGEIVDGADVSLVVGIFGGKPDSGAALGRAISKDRCTVALTDVTITSHTLWVGIGFSNVVVEGRQLIDKSLPGCESRR